MIKWIKRVWNIVTTTLKRKDKDHRDITHTVANLSNIDISPYDKIFNIHTNYRDIVEANRIMNNILSVDIHSVPIRIDNCNPCVVKMYNWFTNDSVLLPTYEENWNNLLINYSKVVNQYFKHRTSTSPILATNIVRIRGHVFSLYNTLKQMDSDIY